MRFIKRIFRTIIILAVVVSIAAYWGARTNFAAKQFARHIASKTGFQTEVASSRLTWRGVAVLSHVRIYLLVNGMNVSEIHILGAPSVEWKFFGPGKSLRIIGSHMILMQTENNVWNPVLLKNLLDVNFTSLPEKLTEIGAKFDGRIDIEDAIFTAQNTTGELLVIIAGADFHFKPLCLKDHTTSAHGIFKTQFIKLGDTEKKDYKTEWLVLDSRIIPLDESLPSAATPEPKPVESQPVESDDDDWF